MNAMIDRGVVEVFRSFVAGRLGLNFDDSKQDFLEDILRQRMENTRRTSYSTYQQLLCSSEDELRVLAEHLTVCETYFFRYAGHFRVFSEIVVPDRLRARAGWRQLRILSAGSASGEEAYSLAILIRDALPELATWNIEIKGIDINPQMVAKATRAKYNAWSLRDTPSKFSMKYFHPEGRDWALDAAIRSMVTFEERNLVNDDPSFWQPGAFDVVFCRNVTMYFTAEAARQVIARIARSLTPGGFLFLGHAENLRGISQDFHLRHADDTFYYQRRAPHEIHSDLILSQDLPASRPSPAQTPAMMGPSDSWFDVIRRASERISSLTNGRDNHDAAQPKDHGSPTAAIPAWQNAGSDRNLALELLRKEKFAEAIEVVHALPIGLKTDRDVQLLLAVLLTNKGEIWEAERVCMGLLEVDDLNAGAHYLMALCREHANDQAAAAEHDQAAIYLDPLFAMPHLHLGLMAKRAGEVEAARKELEAALTLLEREDASRILLLGGGFSREALSEFCRTELRTLGGRP